MTIELSADDLGMLAAIEPPDVRLLELIADWKDELCRRIHIAQLRLVGEGIETCRAGLASDRRRRLGGTFDIGTMRAESARENARCNCAGRWRRSRQSCGASVCISHRITHKARLERRAARQAEVSDATAS